MKPNYGVALLRTKTLLARLEAARMQAAWAINDKARQHWQSLTRLCEREIERRQHYDHA
jgi:hypothetical protein